MAKISLDMADVKPSIMNAIIILMMVAITVPLAKYVFNRYQVPGITALVNAI